MAWSLALDPARCPECGACVRSCAPGALGRDERPAEVVYGFAASRCTGCGACVEACASEALALSPAAPAVPAAPAAPGVLMLACLPRVRCRACGREGAGAEADPCASCRAEEIAPRLR
ncbi:MAG: 4Fe-4S dicluster domain-containing protein [Planctomycetota bacterium]